ncbi:MAG: SPOR domain-containing protein [Pyrinomonadaceae bacterium]|nr:SPOR domain-containing protein [Sphingobacteriaceae bacterium]
MDIAKFISDLLNEYHEVSLPGIGTFYTKNASSYFNDGKYYPPSQSIEFKEDNGSADTLIQHIIKVKHISESSALYFIERFCENLTTTIKTDKEVDIAPLGVLTKADSGYRFTASPDWKSTSFFGLPAINEAGIIPNEHKFRAAIPVAEGVSSTSLEEFDEENEDESPRSSALWISILLLVLVAGFAGLAYVYYPQSFRTLFSQKNKAPKAKVAVPVIKPKAIVKDSVSFADSILNELEKQGMQGSEVKKTPDSVSITTKPVTAAADTIKTPIPSTTFEIIIASFGLRSEAQRSAKAFIKKGMDARVIEDTKKPKFKISIGSFPSSSAAHKENRRVQKEITPDSWVLTLKNK